MFLTVHATAGIIIGQSTGNIFLAFLAGFASHFLLDIIPHGDQDLGGGRKKDFLVLKKILLKLGLADLAVMAVMVGVLYFSGAVTFKVTIIAALAGTILPDFINALYIFYKLPELRSYNQFHTDLHFAWNNFTIGFKQGLILQFIFLIFFLVLL